MENNNADQTTKAADRKNPLKDVEVPLRDQIEKKLFNRLEEMEIASHVNALWTQGQSNRATLNERQKAWLQSWDEFLLSDTDGSFNGSFNLHVPMPYTVAKTLHARYLQAIWVDPPFSCKARNEASMESVPLVRDTLKYYLQDAANYNKGVESVVDEWVWEWLTTGTGILKTRWDRVYTRFVDVEKVTELLPPKYIIDPETGKEFLKPQTRLVDKEVKKTKKVFEGPVIELVNFEDLVTIGHTDPDLADAVLHRQMLTASELWTLADQKIFDKEAVECVIDSGGDSQTGKLGNDLKELRKTNAGRSAQELDTELERYEIIEAYLRLDIDDSGINSDVIVWVHPKSSELLRATYLHRVSREGERPFGKSVFHQRKGQEHGVGIIEMLYPLSKELDALRNMRLDFGLLSTMPFGFFRSASGIDPSTIQLAPGSLIPVENPQTDVFFPNLGNRTVFGFQEEQALQTMVERLTSISDLNLGLMSGQGATRTATGARALVGEMGANLDLFLRRLNRGWKRTLRYLLHQLQLRIPDGLAFRVTGDDGKDYWRRVKSNADLAGDFDIDVSPNSASSNQNIQENIAQNILNLTSNPLDIQLGIITPLQRYEALKNYFQAIGAKDYGRFLQAPAPKTRFLTPEEEANRLLRGIDVPVDMDGDHEGFIAYFQNIFKNDELLGQYTKDQAILLAAQSRRHELMAQAVKQMAAQAAQAQQMQQAQMMSAQQAQPGAGAQPTAAGTGAAGAAPQEMQ